MKSNFYVLLLQNKLTLNLPFLIEIYFQIGFFEVLEYRINIRELTLKYYIILTELQK